MFFDKKMRGPGRWVKFTDMMVWFEDIFDAVLLRALWSHMTSLITDNFEQNIRG